jgi:GTP-sensing pleiotropic transcriptional regulator CodY
MKERTLGDIAAELEGLEGLIAMIEMLVQPTETDIRGSTPTQETVDRAFYSIGETIHHIRDEVNEWEGKYIALSKGAL